VCDGVFEGLLGFGTTAVMGQKVRWLCEQIVDLKHDAFAVLFEELNHPKGMGATHSLKDKYIAPYEVLGALFAQQTVAYGTIVSSSPVVERGFDTKIKETAF
jgi:hypothetical protein